MFRRFVSLLIVCCCLSVAVQAQGTAAAAADVASRIVDSKLIDRVFAWLTREKTPKEVAQPLVRELYASLLDARTSREALKAAVQSRIALLNSAASAASGEAVNAAVASASGSLVANRDEILFATRKLGQSLTRMRNAFDKLHVSLDQYNASMADDIDSYLGVQGRMTSSSRATSQSATVTGIQAGNWSLDRASDLQVIYDRLEANNRLISNAITQTRELTNKFYPAFGALLPGAGSHE